VSLPPSLRVLPFVFADALSALFIARAANACACARLTSPRQPENGQATTWATPRRCALLYLWNPCSAAACIGCVELLTGFCPPECSPRNTWSSLETCIMLAGACLLHSAPWHALIPFVAAISSALDRRPKAAALCLALAIHFSLHPVVLVSGMLTQPGHALSDAPRAGGTAGAARQTQSIALSPLAGNGHIPHFPRLGYAGASARRCCARMDRQHVRILAGAETMFSRTPFSADSRPLQRADDLSPNMGLWWYFFAEIFDHFRAFFLFVFHVQPLLLLVPLTLRLQHKPLVLTVITCLLITLFKVGCR
jgi:GPI transamidase subunit PIG-U